MWLGRVLSVFFGSNACAGFLAALTFALPAAAAARSADPLDGPMQFVLAHGDAGFCPADGSCPEWIVAEGQIVPNTATKFKRLLAKLGDRKPPIVMRSPGGDVTAALELGRLIRKNGLSIAVGGTRARDCGVDDPLCAAGREADGSIRGATYSSDGVCFSACPFAFAGGVRRVASPFTYLGVHQITTTYDEVRVKYRTEYQVVNGRRRVVASREVGRKIVGQHTTTKLSKTMRKKLLAYFKSMGVEPAILDMSMSASPRSIYLIPEIEAAAIHLTTEFASADDLVMAGPCLAGRALSSCLAERWAPTAPAVVAPVLVPPAPSQLTAQPPSNTPNS
jgi:hypothetical protein